MPRKEYIFKWFDWKNCSCGCRVRIFDGHGEFSGKIFVVATDINHGNSVTNEAEHIATLVAKKENIEVSDLVFVEHYRASGRFEETYDRVEFEVDAYRRVFINPRWTHWTRAALEKYCGEPIKPENSAAREFELKQDEDVSTDL